MRAVARYLHRARDRTEDADFPTGPLCPPYQDVFAGAETALITQKDERECGSRPTWARRPAPLAATVLPVTVTLLFRSPSGSLSGAVQRTFHPPPVINHLVRSSPTLSSGRASPTRPRLGCSFQTRRPAATPLRWSGESWVMSGHKKWMQRRVGRGQKYHPGCWSGRQAGDTPPSVRLVWTAPERVSVALREIPRYV